MKKIICMITLFCFIFTFIFPNNFINEKLDEQDNILNALEDEMNSIRLLVSSLQDENKDLITYSQSLENRVDICNKKIDEMQETIESMRKALLSNKEDTNEVISILGDMQQELDNYKIYLSQVEKKLKRTDVFVQIIIPTLSLPMIANGTYLYFNGKEQYGKICIISGVSLFIGVELVWNGGKFIFKIW